MVSLSTNICGIKLSVPLMNASGVLAVTPTLARRVAGDPWVGAVVTKSITLKPRNGFKPPVLWEVNGIGFINAMGLPNPGMESIKFFVEDVKSQGKVIIVSIAGSNYNEFSRLAEYALESGADAVEVNLSCPHTRKYGIELGVDPDEVYVVTKKVVDGFGDKPVFIKIGLTDSLLKTVEKAIKAGACGVTAINTIKSMYIDIWSARVMLTNKYGGLSGPAIHPVALRVIYDVYKEFGETVSIIGAGGVTDYASAIRFFLAGASAVQIGSALIWYGLEVFKTIGEGMMRYLKAQGFKTLSEIIGLTHRLEDYS